MNLGVLAALALQAATPLLVQIPSSIDGSAQPSFLSLPDSLNPARPTALAVVLHTWSFDYKQRQPTLEAGALARGWIVLAPNFRGRNDHAEACGSTLAQQDILDAVQWVRERYPVDPRRIYLMGMSGGGYMTLLMAGRHPELWAAASAWVGIGDIGLWYADHGTDTFGAMMRRCFGGAPGSSDSVSAEYRARSPVTWLSRAASLPLDIAAGRDDPEVPMSQSVLAFNALATGMGSAPVSPDELAELMRPQGTLSRPTIADTAADTVWARRHWLRRVAGPSRLTIFDGVHEWIPRAVLDWLDRHIKQGLP